MSQKVCFILHSSKKILANITSLLSDKYQANDVANITSAPPTQTLPLAIDSKKNFSRSDKCTYQVLWRTVGLLCSAHCIESFIWDVGT